MNSNEIDPGTYQDLVVKIRRRYDGSGFFTVEMDRKEIFSMKMNKEDVYNLSCMLDLCYNRESTNNHAGWSQNSLHVLCNLRNVICGREI